MPTYTIDEALESIGFGPFQCHLLFLSGIGFFATNVELIGVSLLRAPLQAAFPQLSNHRFGWLSSVTFMGELVGGLLWGWIGDRWGRRIAFRGTALVAAVAGCLGALAPCFYTLALTRFILGLAIGGSLAIDFVYFVEFVPTTARGFRTTFIVLLGICAFFYTALIGWLTLPNWRWYLFACGAPYVTLLGGRCFWRWESPRFLLTRGKVTEARAVLGTMAHRNGRALPIGELEFEPHPGNDEEIKATDLKITSKATPPSGWYNIKSTGMLLPTMTVCALFFFQTFAYYGLTIWFRSFAALHSLSTLDPLTILVLIGVVELPGLALTTLLIERAGRRIVLLTNFAGAALCTALLLAVTNSTGFLAVFSAAYFFIVGCWTAIYVATPEMFPTSCRATAFAIAGACGKMGGMLSPILFGLVWDSPWMSPWMVVAMVAGSFTIAALTAALLMIETKGRNLVD